MRVNSFRSLTKALRVFGQHTDEVLRELRYKKGETSVCIRKVQEARLTKEAREACLEVDLRIIRQGVE